VFVSSHILSEVQQLVDVVGIIARGRLVREGRVEELLREAGSIRVRVAPDEVAGAAIALGPVAAGAGVTPGTGPEAGWLTVNVDPARGAEVNRALAGAGIYASRLETGTTLEGLFLELTGSHPEASDAPPSVDAAPPTTGWRS
jgi:ABC-type multidrug transport system ATPase subunit